MTELLFLWIKHGDKCQRAYTNKDGYINLRTYPVYLSSMRLNGEQLVDLATGLTTVDASRLQHIFRLSNQPDGSSEASAIELTGDLGTPTASSPDAVAPGTRPITITIYDPHETPDTYETTFKNAQKFEKFMDRGNITSLFKDGKPPGINDFNDLVPGATYTTAVRSIPARVSNLEQHKEHLVRRREQEFACAIIDDLASEDIQAQELSEERVAKGEQRDAAEVDVAVRFEHGNGMGFVVGSMKTSVGGDSDVRNLEKKIKEHYAQRAPFAGCRIQPAFMAETVKPGQLDRLKATCREKGVRLYARNGRSISRVQLKASVGLR